MSSRFYQMQNQFIITFVVVCLTTIFGLAYCQATNEADNIEITKTQIILTYASKPDVAIGYDNIQKVHIACDGKGSRYCGLAIFTTDGTKYRTKRFTNSDNAKAMRDTINEQVKVNN